jgi:hypothetical protein
MRDRAEARPRQAGRRRSIAAPAGSLLRAWLPGPVGRADAARRWEEWTFSIQGAGDEARSWTWDEFTALPAEDVTVDIHYVTKCSKLDTR